jgi:hypothetical protein
MTLTAPPRPPAPPAADPPPGWAQTGSLHAAVLYPSPGWTLTAECHAGTGHLHLTVRHAGQVGVTGALPGAQLPDLIAALDHGHAALFSVPIPGGDVHALIELTPDALTTGHFTLGHPHRTRRATAPLPPGTRRRLADILRHLRPHP